MGPDMIRQLIGYARTSTTDQDAGLEAQVRDLKALGCTLIFQEQVSSVAEHRPELERALASLVGGHTLVVTKLDRLARSVLDLWGIIKRIEGIDANSALRILNFKGETVDTKSAMGRLMLTLFGGLAEFERGMMLERQAEGITKARAQGKYKGRKPTARAKCAGITAMIDGGMAPVEAARALGVSRATAYRAAAARA